jgi:hypothetical protein
VSCGGCLPFRIAGRCRVQEAASRAASSRSRTAHCLAAGDCQTSMSSPADHGPCGNLASQNPPRPQAGQTPQGTPSASGGDFHTESGVISESAVRWCKFRELMLGDLGEETMIRSIAVAAIVLTVATSAQAMSSAPLGQPDGMITQVRMRCGLGTVPVNGVCVARTTVRYNCIFWWPRCTCPHWYGGACGWYTEPRGIFASPRGLF